ncbi:hypothetical protein H2198_003588 [Neophaeococcomyces mojaviensis]|uniref:Uncharacterized protein n=1 Tax=Neophaeococcomyces mojaviensis TaxID=3383035 RepID=A0ACC3AB81_9EURO|nr:hypothetical protein H2198_003588 [Knufia sp. JES_112]
MKLSPSHLGVALWASFVFALTPFEQFGIPPAPPVTPPANLTDNSIFSLDARDLLAPRQSQSQCYYPNGWCTMTASTARATSTVQQATTITQKTTTTDAITNTRVATTDYVGTTQQYRLTVYYTTIYWSYWYYFYTVYRIQSTITTRTSTTVYETTTLTCSASNTYDAGSIFSRSRTNLPTPTNAGVTIPPTPTVGAILIGSCTRMTWAGSVTSDCETELARSTTSSTGVGGGSSDGNSDGSSDGSSGGRRGGGTSNANGSYLGSWVLIASAVVSAVLMIVL